MAGEWDKTTPIPHTLISDLPTEIKDVKVNTLTVLEKEHRTLGDGNSGAEHKQGSAISYFLPTASSPTLRPDGSTALTIDDAGRLWFDTTTKQLKVLESVGPIVWVVLPETTQANTWAEVQTFTKLPVIPDTGPGIIPVGGITQFAGSSAPTGWLLCDGSQLTEGDTGETYEALYDVIGFTYGGAGVSDFNVPDMRGRIPIGVGTGDASDATAHTLADKEGTETHVLLEAEMPSHNHGLNQAYSGSGTGSIVVGPGTDSITATTGGDTAHNNLQPSLTLNYIIKY